MLEVGALLIIKSHNAQLNASLNFLHSLQSIEAWTVDRNCDFDGSDEEGQRCTPQTLAVASNRNEQLMTAWRDLTSVFMIARKSASPNQQFMHAEERDATGRACSKTDECVLEIEMRSDIGCGKTHG